MSQLEQRCLVEIGAPLIPTAFQALAVAADLGGGDKGNGAIFLQTHLDAATDDVDDLAFEGLLAACSALQISYNFV